MTARKSVTAGITVSASKESAAKKTPAKKTGAKKVPTKKLPVKKTGFKIGLVQKDPPPETGAVQEPGEDAALTCKLERLACDPIAIIAAIACDDGADLRLRFYAAKELATYLMVKPRLPLKPAPMPGSAICWPRCAVG
jgi:hypothetical protein